MRLNTRTASTFSEAMKSGLHRFMLKQVYLMQSLKLTTLQYRVSQQHQGSLTHIEKTPLVIPCVKWKWHSQGITWLEWGSRVQKICYQGHVLHQTVSSTAHLLNQLCGTQKHHCFSIHIHFSTRQSLWTKWELWSISEKNLIVVIQPHQRC